MATNQAYDPTAAQPYQAYEPPQPLPATPTPVGKPAQEGYQFTGQPTTHLGAVAGVLDNLFRGYMKGKESAEIKKVSDVAAKTKNLQSSYNQDAALLYQMAQSGVDQNSDEYKQAVAAVQGSWGALNDWVGQHVNGEDSGKKKSKSKTAQKEQPNLMEDLKSQDPQVKARALYQLQQKVGPPVLWQVKQLNSPEAQASRQAQTQAAQNNLSKEQAQATRDQLAGIPEEKLTPDQKQKLDNANAILFPPLQTRTTRLYRNPDGTQDWFTPGEQPEGATAIQAGATKPYKLANGSEGWFIPGSEPQGATAIVGSNQAPKTGTFGDYVIKKYGEDYTSDEYVKARHEWALAGHVPGAGRGGGSDASDKAYAKWDSYYKEHYPEMGFEERDALVRHKVEGATQQQAGAISHDSITEPQQFDNDVIGAAISNLRALPQYKDMATLDDALANIVGQGDSGYQYHSRADLGKPDKHGKYSGDVDESQLKALERDLQNQIRVVMSGSKETALSPQARRAALNRLQPLFGPAARPQGSGTTPASPQAHAASPAAPASSPAPQGGLPPQAVKQLKAGQITTFGNGQQWTLDAQGKPKQVK